MASSAVSEATKFLSPILDKTQQIPLNNASLTQRLAQSLPTPPHSSDPKLIASAVVTHALDLFQRLHAESRVVAADANPFERLINPAEVRIVTCLLDLIVLEGVYPSLSKGVGVSIERRTRSRALPLRRTRTDRKDVELLKAVVSRLSAVLSDGRGGGAVSAQMIEDRCLVDVVAGCAELAFDPENGDTGEWERQFEMLIDGIPTPKLLPQLLLLLHAQTPSFLRGPLSKVLSNLPLTRPHAVQHIIELFLSVATDTSSPSASASHVSLEALTSASRIICSVPSSVSAPDYFRKVSPELLDLLDSPDPRLARAAGFVVADALGKRGRGAEEAVEEALVRPLISKLDPSPTAREPSTSPSSVIFGEDIELQQPLVSEDDIYNSLVHLELLSSSQPSPSVRQRLIAPLVLPLWALTNYAKSTSRSSWYARASSLLRSHLKTSATTDQDAATTLSKISANITFSGNSDWEFGPGSQGGIEIRPRTSGNFGFNADETESRVQEFLGLLDGGVTASALSDFFLRILRSWLARRNSEGDEDPVGMFTTLKILQGVLSKHEQALGKDPAQMLQIVKGVLDEYVDYREGVKRNVEHVRNPSLVGLGKIVHNAPPPITRGAQGGEEGEEADEESERSQIVTMALSLLSALISSPSTKLTSSDERLLQTLQPPLSYISKPSPTIDPNLSSLALNITSLLSLHPPTTTASETSPAERQKETYLLALSYLRDPLIPVRAHGLHLLRDLITSRAPILDVAGTTRLAIDMLSDKDSFIYLNVVKTLSALADKHSRTVTGMLVDAYLNDGHPRLGLDERLRIGEALLKTVQRLGGALVGETADTIGRGMTAIISRRRIRKGGGSDKGEEWSENEQEEEEEGEEEAEAEAEAEESRMRREEEERRQKAAIIQGWQPKDDSEDLRIRTSALSILGVAIETNPTGMGHRVLADGIDIALSVLTLETAAEKGILRRAAVVCIGSLLKSLVGINEDAEGHAWRAEVWVVLGHRLKDVKNTLRYLVLTDKDGLVREQAAVILENLEAVIQRWIVGSRGGGGGY